jgi:hypothetical protein
MKACQRLPMLLSSFVRLDSMKIRVKQVVVLQEAGVEEGDE